MATPLMDQYNRIKAEHPDDILLFRLGDFYEMFFDDAKTASRDLGIVLTSRSKGPNRIPMAGIPHHSSLIYINRLLQAGHRVALCEQTQDAEEAEGLVERGVVRVITPGTLLEESILEEKQNNFLAAAVAEGGLAWVDLSTGTFQLTTVPPERIRDEIMRLSPSEILVPSALEQSDFARNLEGFGRMIVTPFADWRFDPENAFRALTEHFQVKTLEGFGCPETDPGVRAAGAALAYLHDTQRGPLRHISKMNRHHAEDRLFLDEQTQRALELTETMRGGARKGTLLWALDRTESAMGARRLREWVTLPLQTVEEIRGRHAAVQELVGSWGKVQKRVRPICDLERVAAKVGTGRANARDLSALRETLGHLPEIRSLEFSSPLLRNLPVGEHPELRTFLETALADDPPAPLTEGGLIRDGFDAELDEVRSASRDGKGWIARFEAAEIERTGISSLRVGYTQVFGYYIEVTHTHREKVPENYTRKQTLKNAERFITPELKEVESKVLHAEERSKKLEYRIFQRVRERVAQDLAGLQETGNAIARLDVIASLARVAEENNYVVPEIDDSRSIDIRDGRHPVLERTLQEKFVPNDVKLEEDDVILITGPNMAGKSTYIRQSALLVLMAHIGSFVPAASARIGVVDRIFTRSGASDEIARGQSTFMVEMNETANILNHATDRSLIILDEIGRGTSTFDGVSIAWAVTEYIHDHLKARTFFATHYHELTELAEVLPGVKNFHVVVREWGDGIVFLHKIAEGLTDKSYGIHVARLAGIPRGVVDRAKVILAGLEALTLDENDRPRLAVKQARPGEVRQLALFAQAPPPEAPPRPKLIDDLADIDVNGLTPIEALQKLSDLRERARKSIPPGE